MMVNLRLSALGKFENKLPLGHGVARRRPRRTRPTAGDLRHPAGSHCPIYLRSGFKAGDQLKGPAVIEELGATILVYPGDEMQVNEFGQLVIEVGS